MCLRVLSVPPQDIQRHHSHQYSYDLSVGSFSHEHIITRNDAPIYTSSDTFVAIYIYHIYIYIILCNIIYNIVVYYIDRYITYIVYNYIYIIYITSGQNS